MRPQCLDPPPRAEAWIGPPPRDGAIAPGTAYTDGALKGSVPKARRGGWAFVMDDGHAPLWGKFGTCAETYTSVLRAELRALAEILGVSAGNLTVYVDNSQVVDGIALGREWCCFPKRDGADIWRDVWKILKGMDGIKVKKVKAHLKYKDAVGGRLPWHARVGNGVADM